MTDSIVPLSTVRFMIKMPENEVWVGEGDGRYPKSQRA